jgi:hypothetical protein
MRGGSYASPQPAKPFSEAYLERDSGDKSGEERRQQENRITVMVHLGMVMQIQILSSLRTATACLLFVQPILPSSLIGSVPNSSCWDTESFAACFCLASATTQPQRHPASCFNLTCAGHTPAPCSHGCDGGTQGLSLRSLSWLLAQLTVQLSTSIISLACVLSLLCARHAMPLPA